MLLSSTSEVILGLTNRGVARILIRGGGGGGKRQIIRNDVIKSSRKEGLFMGQRYQRMALTSNALFFLVTALRSQND